MTFLTTPGAVATTEFNAKPCTVTHDKIYAGSYLTKFLFTKYVVSSAALLIHSAHITTFLMSV